MRGSTHSRRDFLRYSALLSAGVALTGVTRGVAAQTNQDVTTATDGMDDGCQVMLDDPNNRQGEYVELNGARIFYQVTGQGEPMLLIHGYPLSGALFSRVRDELSMYFQVITIDLRGYGMSETPDIPDSIQVYAEDALALLDHLGIETAIVGGMSMGGPITLEMYQLAPERFSGMILIDTIAAAATPAEAGQWRGVAEMVEMGGIAAILPVVVHEMLSGDTRMMHPELVSYLETVMLAASAEAGIGGATALATRPDYTALLPQIQVPTLVYVGQDDMIYPFEIARMMHQAIPGSELAIIPNAAHAAIFEEPGQSAMAIHNWALSNGLVEGDDTGNGGGMTPEAGSTVLTAQLFQSAGGSGIDDPEVFGFARITVNPTSGQLCYRLSVANVEPTGAQIHLGGSCDAGMSVVSLDVTGGLTSACMMVDPALAQAMIANPMGYSIVVMTSEFPEGAVRGYFMAQ